MIYLAALIIVCYRFDQLNLAPLTCTVCLCLNYFLCYSFVLSCSNSYFRPSDSAPCAVWDYEDSEHLATLLISCTLEGSVLPPMLILKVCQFDTI